MSDEEEVDLLDLDIDKETGEVVRRELPSEPTDAPKQIKGSVSLIKDYQACPAKAYGRITRQKQTKGVALVQGIAVHEAIEAYIKEGADMNKVFEETLVMEAEKNEIPLTGKDALSARRIGPECLIAAKTILDDTGKTGVPFFKRMDPDLVEKLFVIELEGRKFTGKMDFLYVFPDGRYSIGDWKTGKNAPSEFELATDLQFTFYAWAAKNDPKMPTYGKLPFTMSYIHLQGCSTEKDAAGKTVPKNRTKKPLKYSFKTERDEETIQRQFDGTVIPIMEQMEAGAFPRNEGKNCSWCGFYNKAKQRCEVELPYDQQAKRRAARGQTSMFDLTLNQPVEELREAELKSPPEPTLFGNSELTEFAHDRLKPYSEAS